MTTSTSPHSDDRSPDFEGAPRTAPFEQPDDTLKGSHIGGRHRYPEILDGSAERLEIAKGRYIPDGRIFTPYLDRRAPFVIPDDTQALILDFDGTCTPFNLTEGIRQKAFRKVIIEQLHHHFSHNDPDRVVTREEIETCHNPAVGHPERDMCNIIAEQLTTHFGISVAPQLLWERWQVKITDLMAGVEAKAGHDRMAAVVKGLPALLEGAMQRNIPIALCTAGAAEYVERFIEAIGLHVHLDETANVYTNRHPNIRTKPYADPYLLTCERLGVDPTKVVIGEDSATGALAALRSGGLVMFQPSGKRNHTILSLHNKVKQEHPEWFEERRGRIALLAAHRGWKQVRFCDNQG